MPESRPIRVVTVDDQARFRALAHQVIDATPGFDAVAEAGNASDGVALVAVLCPDIVLLDARLPGLGGMEAARRIVQAGTTRLVVLLACDLSAIPADLTACADLVAIRKEQLCPGALREAWARAGRQRASGATAARRAAVSSTIASP